MAPGQGPGIMGVQIPHLRLACSSSLVEHSAYNGEVGSSNLPRPIMTGRFGIGYRLLNEGSGFESQCGVAPYSSIGRV